MTKQSVLAMFLVLATAGSACTIVTPGGTDGGIKPIPIPRVGDGPPPPKPLEANLLFMVNLDRSAANLAKQYATIMTQLGGYLEGVGLKVQAFAVAPTYADTLGPRLLLGRKRSDTPPPSVLRDAVKLLPANTMPDYVTLLPALRAAARNISDEDLPIALQLLASTGAFDGDGETAEGKNVIALAGNLGGTALPPDQGGVERSALFDQPRDLFIVVHMQALRRRCALDTPECQVNGRAPLDILTETGADGGAVWLKFASGSIRQEQVVHVAITTSEGETPAAFRSRCGKVPGFPLALFDVIEPSPNLYYKPMMAALNVAHAGTGHIGDFCELVGEKPEEAFKRLGRGVAAVAGTP